jgi:serine O-acetyltransferase
MTHEPFFTTFAADMRRAVHSRGRSSAGRRLLVLLGSRGLWALAPYRFGRSLKTRPVPILQPLLWGWFRAWEHMALLLTGTHIDVAAGIGPGLVLDDWESVWIGPGVVMGSGCTVRQMTCILPGADGLAPVVGNSVSFGAAAKVVGGVRIGDNATIGAGAWVADDVPPDAVVVGNPGRYEVSLDGRQGA